MIRVRTRREIKLIAKSAQIVADTLDMLSTKVISGVSLLELDALAEEFIRSRGARPAFKGFMGFPATLFIARNDEVVQVIPANSKLLVVRIFGIDSGAEKNG